MLVRDFMIKDVITTKPEESIKELMIKFIDHKIGSVPVVDENGILKGMVSDGDILRYLKPGEYSFYDFYAFIIFYSEEELKESIVNKVKMPVSKLFKKTGIEFVHEEDDLKQVISILSKHHFKKLPVIDNNHKVVGVISRGDVIRYIKEAIIRKS